MALPTDSIAIEPIAPYVGGKARLAKVLIERIGEIPHTSYAEPFVGLGGVFLRRKTRARAEIINDYSREVSNLFRVVRSHPDALTQSLELQLTSRDEFERLKAANPDTMTDVERAARFIYLQRLAYGGKVTERHFGVAKHRSARFDKSKVIPGVQDLNDRLSHVVIESLPFKVFITRYDSPETLFYLDPPYAGCEDYYGRGLFQQTDFEVIRETLTGIRGKFLMSLSDTEEARALYQEFQIEPVKTTYSVQGAGRHEVGELLISNIEP